jgi:PQQ-dependent catabolism-associated CXXCW motif protein
VRPVRSILAGSFAATALLARAAAAQPDAPPEPDGYRMEDYRSPTPATLKGAKVVSTGDAAALWREGSSAFIDVLPRAPKPQNLPPGTIWRDTPHHSLPGAIWLPNTGYGSLSAEAEAYFRRGLQTATKGDPQRPITFFCQRACWMSWNAAKRALEYGYGRVSWFPDGTDGWLDAGLPLQRIEPHP